MNVQIPFPKRIKFSKMHPLVDFYSKCMKEAFDSEAIDKVQVWAFSINPKDNRKLSELLKKHIKKNYPYLPYKKIDITLRMELLNIGPRVDKKVQQGQVLINTDELYANEN